MKIIEFHRRTTAMYGDNDGGDNADTISEGGR